MPVNFISCLSLPPATILSVPIYDFAQANPVLANKATQEYFPCCGKSICGGCVHSFNESGNNAKCPFCNSDRADKTDEEDVEKMMKRVEVNDEESIYALGTYYYHGQFSLVQDREKAMELWKKAAELGSSKAHFQLGTQYDAEGNSKKAKVHYEAAAIAGHEIARYNLGCNEYHAGNVERALKHWIIAASAGSYQAMANLLAILNEGSISQNVNSTLAAYNNSCAEMRSEARDAYINKCIDVGRRL